jgi:hypothetical protein
MNERRKENRRGEEGGRVGGTFEQAKRMEENEKRIERRHKND